MKWQRGWSPAHCSRCTPTCLTSRSFESCAAHGQPAGGCRSVRETRIGATSATPNSSIIGGGCGPGPGVAQGGSGADPVGRGDGAAPGAASSRSAATRDARRWSSAGVPRGRERIAVDPFVEGRLFGGVPTREKFEQQHRRPGSMRRRRTGARTTAPGCARRGRDLDLLYIDGKHDYWTVSDDLRWAAHLPPAVPVLIHDCFSSIGVTLGICATCCSPLVAPTNVASAPWLCSGWPPPRCGPAADRGRDAMVVAQRVPQGAVAAAAATGCTHLRPRLALRPLLRRFASDPGQLLSRQSDKVLPGGLIGPPMSRPSR